MCGMPSLTTERLVLRPFTLSDAPRVQELAGDERIAATTLTVPHPYQDGMADEWIATHADNFSSGRGLQLAVTLAQEDRLIGAIGLGITRPHRRAELGYWIGLPYWGRGYCTEAAQVLVEHAFHALGLHKITSRHLRENPASGRVMEKIGMTREGTLIDDTWKNGQPRSVHVYGLVGTQKADHGY